MNKFSLKVKCKFYKELLAMPYEEVYLQRLDDDPQNKKKLKQFPKKS